MLAARISGWLRQHSKAIGALIDAARGQQEEPEEEEMAAVTAACAAARQVWDIDAFNLQPPANVNVLYAAGLKYLRGTEESKAIRAKDAAEPLAVLRGSHGSCLDQQASTTTTA